MSDPTAAPLPARLRGRPRASTPALIEAAAVAVFEEKGYEQTSIEDVTAAAGVSRSTLFRYVNSKGGLLWLHKGQYDVALTESLDRAATDRPVVDVLVDALVHTLMAELDQRGLDVAEVVKAKWRIVAHAQGPAEVSMAARLEWAVRLREYVETHVTGPVPEALLGGLPHAFISAAFSACFLWAESEADGAALAELIREALHPLALGYGPVLEPMR